MIRVLERNIVLRKLFFEKSEIERSLIASYAFSISMVLFRVVYTGETMFLFLVWNLFLGWLPYIISSIITQKQYDNGLRFYLFVTLWLLLLPNAFYIITDLFHLRDRYIVPLWFDLVIIISFAWNGLITGVLSMRQMEKIFNQKWKIKTDWLFIFPLMFLNALGIYIGRFLRYNSWDVITNPLQLYTDVMHLILDPIKNRFDWSMMICFAFLLTIFYMTLKRISSYLHQ